MPPTAEPIDRQTGGGEGHVFSFGVGLFHFLALFPFLLEYRQYTGSGLGKLDPAYLMLTQIDR